MRASRVFRMISEEGGCCLRVSGHVVLVQEEALRSWAFEGSIDGTENSWHVLDPRDNNKDSRDTELRSNSEMRQEIPIPPPLSHWQESLR